MQPNASETCADGSEMVRNWIQELSEDVRRGRLQHWADIIEDDDPDEDGKMGRDESVPDVRHGRPHSRSEPEGTTILEGNVVERSNRSLIVPEPGELRQHLHEEFDRQGTASDILGRPASWLVGRTGPRTGCR